MRLSSFTLLIIVTVLISALSCSVKEDRGDCPCYLRLLPSEERKLSETGGFLLQVYDSARDVEVKDSIPWKHFEHSEYETSVKRGVKTLSCVSGKTNQTLDGERLVIRKGYQADSLFVGVQVLTAFSDRVDAFVNCYKQYANIFVKYKNSSAEDFPFLFRVKGNVCGIDVRSMKVLEGEFEYCPPGADEYDVVHFRVPRQLDNTLVLELVDPDTLEAVECFRIGEAIESVGFDWTVQDLDDIYLGIDKVVSGISVRILDWEHFSYTEII